MKNKSGITLIALIITIIIMLILVGVTINFAINGGIINKAKEASINTEEKLILENLISMAVFTNDGSIDVEETYVEIQNEYGQDKVSKNGNKLSIIGKNSTYNYKLTDNEISIYKENDENDGNTENNNNNTTENTETRDYEWIDVGNECCIIIYNNKLYSCIGETIIYAGEFESHKLTDSIFNVTYVENENYIIDTNKTYQIIYKEEQNGQCYPTDIYDNENGVLYAYQYTHETGKEPTWTIASSYNLSEGEAPSVYLERIKNNDVTSL